jgi:hypothetical protein
MKLLFFFLSFVSFACSTKPIVVVDLTKWYNSVRFDEYSNSYEYFSFIGSNLSGKHYALMNFDKYNENLIVTFALNKGDFEFKNNDSITARFDNRPSQEFKIHHSSSSNIINILEDEKFAQMLANSKRLRIRVKIRDFGEKTLDWRKVEGLQEIFYRTPSLTPVRI